LTSYLSPTEKSTQLKTVWIPAAAPLVTRWAKDVSPTSARPDYPRPDAVRSKWKSLNGLWDLALEDPDVIDHQILVPFSFESALSGIGKGKEVHERITYRRNFRIPSGWRGQRIILHFGAVDWEAVVKINGQEVGRHRGGYSPFSFDITDLLTQGEEQEIEVHVFDPAAYDPHAFGMIPKAQEACQPMGKQLGSVGIWYTRATGIWQTVWLEPVAASHITSHRIIADPSGEMTVTTQIAGDADTLVVHVFKEGHLVASSKSTVSDSNVETKLKITSPDLWCPETPTLYDITLTLKKGRQNVDRVRTYAGFRSISIVDGYLALNGKPYMIRGVLDQGYWPDGIYTAPTEEALLDDILNTKAMGFNAARKHAKVDEARWYYLCDKHGLLVVQDMPSSQDLSKAEARGNYMNEWSEVVHTLWNHPSVILWVPFNENWGNPGEFQDDVADFTKSLDKTRLVIDASGWTQRSKTDIIDHHDYTNNLAQYAKDKPEIPMWVGEYAGIAYPVEGHTWMKWWGYQSVKSSSKLLQKVRFLTKQMTDNPGFSGFCFTQLCDVEQELNGLLTYDRIPKAPLEKIAEIFRAPGEG
jgi:beta-galactosidase/beta-glucuronidase